MQASSSHKWRRSLWSRSTTESCSCNSRWGHRCHRCPTCGWTGGRSGYRKDRMWEWSRRPIQGFLHSRGWSARLRIEAVEVTRHVKPLVGMMEVVEDVEDVEDAEDDSTLQNTVLTPTNTEEDDKDVSLTLSLIYIYLNLTHRHTHSCCDLSHVNLCMIVILMTL